MPETEHNYALVQAIHTLIGLVLVQSITREIVASLCYRSLSIHVLCCLCDKHSSSEMYKQTVWIQVPYLVKYNFPSQLFIDVIKKDIQQFGVQRHSSRHGKWRYRDLNGTTRRVRALGWNGARCMHPIILIFSALGSRQLRSEQEVHRKKVKKIQDFIRI